MTKKVYVILWGLVFLLAFSLVKVEAGTFAIGAKYWYETTWDSALLDIVDQIFSDGFEEMGFYNVESDTHVGTGYLAGPVFGYQTSDNLWSISFAPMIISSFSQKIVGSVLADLDLCGTGLPIPVQGNTKTTVDVTRIDYDFAISYSLLDYKDRFSFLEYCKVFLGLKYQSISYDFELTTRVAIFEETDTTEFDYEVYMPTVGVGFVYPLTEDIAAGIQGGIGMARFYDINVDDSLAFNVEATVSIVPVENMIIQFGYRYQEFSFDLQYSNPDKTYKSEDKTYGPTVSLIFTF
ncbi:MAG: hypothetical protein GY732_06190 [Gammaproteobacteria bacterium]|nr:hypothetical protein [Gammaproteobacteria bacterium]